MHCRMTGHRTGRGSYILQLPELAGRQLCDYTVHDSVLPYIANFEM